jgi:hypothetical protein
MQIDDTKIRYMQLTCRSVACEIRVNDIPVTKASADDAKSASQPIRQYLLKGENRLDILLGDETAPPQQGGFEGSAQVSVRVADFVEGEDMGPDKGIERASLSPAIADDTPNPSRVSTVFSSAVGDGWFWSEAPLLDPVAARPQIDRAMAELAHHFAARDTAALLPFFEPAIRDRSAAYPQTTIELQVVMFNMLFDNINSKTWEAIPFDPANARYRSVADGRMIQAVGLDGLPLIRSVTTTPHNPSEDSNYVALMGCLGVHNGQLKFMT